MPISVRALATRFDIASSSANVSRICSHTIASFCGASRAWCEIIEAKFKVVAEFCIAISVRMDFRFGRL